MTKLDDLALIRKIKENDQKALEELFMRYYFALCHFAKTLIKRSDSSEELVADLFYSIWQNREKLQINSNVKAYLYISIKNQSFNYLKTNCISMIGDYSVEDGQPMSGLSADTSLNYRELEGEIEKAISRLPRQRQIIFKLNRFEGLTYREIAAKLSISVSTVQNQMSEAVRFMAKYKSKFYFFFFLLNWVA